MNAIYGMIHLPNLKFYSKTSLENVIQQASSEVAILEETGFTGAVIENFFDAPFEKTRVSDEVFSKLSIICHRLREQSNFDLGLNILRNASVQAMTIASICDFQFIRSNVWEGVYVTDQGIIESAAVDVIREKHLLNSSVKVFADINVKHASPLSRFSLIESAEQALGRGGADEIILSGSATGKETSLSDIEIVNKGGYFPFIGSGLTRDNLHQYKEKIKGGIVGTALKDSLQAPIDKYKAQQFIDTWNSVFI